MKILIATGNPGKAREMSEIFGEDFELVSLSSLSNPPEINETGTTFIENSALKAKTYYEWSGIPTIAGDGGLVIDALGGEPGVFSRRWPTDGEEPGKPGREKTDQEMIDIALLKLQGVPPENRSARLVDAESFYDGTHLFTEEDAIAGHITQERATNFEKGYPFRAIFSVDAYSKLFQDLSTDEHAEVNHRTRALKKLLALVKDLA